MSELPRVSRHKLGWCVQKWKLSVHTNIKYPPFSVNPLLANSLRQPNMADALPNAKRARKSGAYSRPGTTQPASVGFKGFKKGAGTKKKPKAKKKAAPKSAALSPYAALRMMSPFHANGPPPSAVSLGAFVTTNHVRRGTLSIPANEERLVFFAPSVRGAYQVHVWKANGVGTAEFFNFSPAIYLNEYNAATKPVNWRPLRAGCRIKSITSTDDRAGYVQILTTVSPTSLVWDNATGLNANDPLDFNLTGNSYNSLKAQVQGARTSKCLTSDQLSGVTHTFVSYPASFQNYTGWGDGEIDISNPLQIGNNVQHAKIRSVAQEWLDAEKTMSLSNTLIYFAPSAKAQTFLLEFGLQAAERHTESSPMASMMKTPSSGMDPSKLRQSLTVVENAAGHLVETMGGIG